MRLSLFMEAQDGLCSIGSLARTGIRRCARGEALMENASRARVLNTILDFADRWEERDEQSLRHI